MRRAGPGPSCRPPCWAAGWWPLWRCGTPSPWATRWGRADRALGASHDHGLKTVIVARVLPVLLYGLVSIACGATGMRWRPYLWGTLIGMAPVIAAASLFGEGLNQMVRAGTVLQTVPVAIGLVAVVLLARLGWAWLAREG